MYEQLLEPLKYYDTVGKDRHEEICAQHIDELIKKSAVDAEENKKTVAEYDKENAAAKTAGKKLRRLKTWRVLMIILTIIAALLTVFAICTIGESSGSIGLLIGSIVAAAASLLIIFLKIRPAIKALAITVENHKKRAAELFAKARAQVAPLMALFTGNEATELIEKTIPEIDFDDKYTKKNEELFLREYDFFDLNNKDSSMLNTISGRLRGNPFVFCERLMTRIVDKVYHGTLLISWTETYRDSKGHISTRRRTQTLHASLTKPMPEYKRHNYLAFGSQAAPNLTFSREPTDVEKMNERQIERAVKKGERKLKKKTQKAVSGGGNFQEMANTEFDVLFGATNRDSEVEFRLMYTPLAQKNTLALMKNKNGFGDDFRFIKQKRCNIIDSEHAQKWSLNASPANYDSHDLEKIKEKFLAFNKNYFCSVFFDLAPLMSVPAYLEAPCASLEDEEYRSNYSYYEHEVMANAVGKARLAHPASKTEAILKTYLLSKDEHGDRVAVTAYSFDALPRLDFVPVLGGDGRIHPVPVHWTEYIPLQNTTTLTVFGADGSKEADAYFHGLKAKIVN